uniref:PKS_AT domain-containing protein n=1 Tax=Syphacia muris TaxID=451379 RepID=A0A0N5ANK8_9BILA
MIFWNGPYNRLLRLAFVFALVPWLYSTFNEQRRIQSYSVERALMLSWDKIVSQPSIFFRRVIVGINCNVDLIVSGTALLEHINSTTTERKDHEVLTNINDLYEAFTYFFSRGAPSERHMSDEKTFQDLVQTAGDLLQRSHYYIGGNAALMSEKIASSFPKTTTYLVGPIGPRLQALLHPSIVRTNSTRIVKDELHVIMEYKQGEILGEYVAPASSRFITSHDRYSGSSVVIEMFFKAISQFNPDLIILTGVHLLKHQNREMRMEKLRLIKRNLMQVDPKVPVHLEMGSISDSDYVQEVLKRIIPHVDSLALNEQELAFFSHVANGPYGDLYPMSPGAVHVHKVVEILYWLITTYGYDKTNPSSANYGYKLSRIHFHSLTFHLMVYRGTDWSNLGAALAAGARAAARQACQATADNNMDNVELRSSISLLLDKQLGKYYNFEPQKPLVSWMRNDVVFVYTPVLVCKFPTRTVGLDDVISATGLLFSQFYRFERSSAWHKLTEIISEVEESTRKCYESVKPVNKLVLCFVRNIRQAAKKSKTDLKYTTGSNRGPVQWIEDAASYSDAFSTDIDSFATFPYPRQVRRFILIYNYALIHRMKTAAKVKEGLQKQKEKKINFCHLPIEKQVVILFPGQGSQFIGMGSKACISVILQRFLTECPTAMDLYEKASEVLKYDVKKLCFEGPKTKIDQTIYCQPAVFVTSMAAMEKAKQDDEHLMEKVTYSAGFSVGEFNSLVLAGVLSFEDALRILKVRAETMHDCSQKVPSGMMTIQVHASTDLTSAIHDSRKFAIEQNDYSLCEIANFLFCGVKVIGASKVCMDFLEQNQDRYGFKVLKRLSVGGAFHTKLMKGAKSSLRKIFEEVQFKKPKINIFSNYTGHLYNDDINAIKSNLVKQVYNPVKWEQIQQLLFRLHEDCNFPTYMEVGPGRQLGTMFLRISKKAFKFYRNVSC